MKRRLSLAFAIALIVLVAVVAGRRRASERAVTARGARPAASVRVHYGAPQRVYPTGGEARETESDQVGALEGRVVSSASGLPVPSAEITFVGPTGAHSARTDAEGAFVLQPDREGSYELVLARHPDFLPFAPELGSSPIAWTARKGAVVTGITLTLLAAVDYTGTVLDPAGARVAGATVTVFDANHGDLGAATIPTTYTTDDRGELRFRAPDGAIIEARHERFSPGRAEIGFSSQTSHRLTITLRPLDPKETQAHVLRGVVRDDRGVALPDVAVTGRHESDNPASDESRLDPGGSARTDAAGAFVLGGLASGTYGIVASDADHAPTALNGIAVDGPPIDVRLTAGATLRGRVIDAATKAPIAAMSLVVSERLGPLVTRPIRTASVFDADGRFAIGALPKGTHLVTASAQGYAPAPEREVALTGDDVLDFELVRGTRVTGIVRDASTKAPIARAKVALEGQLGGSAGAASLTPVVVTDETGHFEVGGLVPGRLTFLVAAVGHHGRVVGDVRVGGPDETPPLDVALTPTKPDEEPKIELVGIGAVLSAVDDGLVIGRVSPGGGAAEAGLGPGDIVLAVDATPVVKLGFAGAIARIRGAENTTVSLLVKRPRGGDPTVLVVPRRRIAA